MYIYMCVCICKVTNHTQDKLIKVNNLKTFIATHILR